MGEGQTPETTHGVRESTSDPARGIPQASVHAALNQILQSQGFRSSRRSQDFLRYVVERTLEGQADALKERTIGIDVFGRSSSYEPSDDATVRVKAGEVRKRLGLYYATEGRLDEIRIDLPHGAYVPEFHRVEAPAEVEIKQPEISEVRGSARRWAIPLGIAAVLVAAAVAWLATRPAATVVDQFWAPVLHGSAPVLLSTAYVPVYGVDPRMAPERPTKLEDFVLLTDQFVGGGDMLAVTRISAMLNRMHRPFRVKIGSDVSFQDLRTAPAVLIGYSYTRWRDISKELRFFIDAESRPRMVTDNGKPTEWSLPNLPADRRTGEDYAIVTRVFHPDTQAMLVEVAGITQYGTEAGADMISNPELLAEALHDAPQGWQNKNLQLVLHVKVISGTPASPKVVKTYFW
ncbi:MAG TPA: hypothetical protein VGP62_15720 [Bryobacteraceae bacterium]|jgi:hypothetical protein|nr:hypothetical protein [Bryobacteraceae bacterium]